MTSGVKIGLEVHVYVKTKAKMFCPCDADFLAASEPNVNVCSICTGQPGAKPMAPNAAAIEAGLRVAHALGSAIGHRVQFLRKHYFYPDLPNNYQRTSEPFAEGGSLLGVPITEIHWEEDPGAFEPRDGVVDYNRSGAPLLEIVTEPDFESPEHARDFLNELRLILAYLDVWRADAGIKADCNVSVGGGERAEVKNVNSVRNVEAALAYEVERQRDALARGEPLVRETRHFDEAAMRTTRLRVKESAADYRFLEDPDLPAAAVPADAIARVDAEEPPLARRARLALGIGVDAAEVSPLLEERALVDAFEDVVARGVPPRAAYDFFVRDFRGELEYRKQRFTDSSVTATEVGDLLKALVVDAALTPAAATRVLRHGLDVGDLAHELERELAASAQAASLDVAALSRDVLTENPKAVDDYRAGKTQVLNFLVGQLMKKTKGRVAADDARSAVKAALDAA